jgi:hypothetical protein
MLCYFIGGGFSNGKEEENSGLGRSSKNIAVLHKSENRAAIVGSTFIRGHIK